MTENRGTNREDAQALSDPANLRIVLAVLFIGCVLLLLGEFVVQRHVSIDEESLFGFYALFGFAAGAILILVAWGLRKLVMRSEDYYDTMDD